MNKIGKLIGAVLLVGSLIGMAFAVDNFYLRSSRFEAFASNYAADRSEQKVDALMQRQWKIDDRIDLLTDEDPRKNRAAIKALQEQRQELQEQIEREKAKLKTIYEEKK